MKGKSRRSREGRSIQRPSRESSYDLPEESTFRADGRARLGADTVFPFPSVATIGLHDKKSPQETFDAITPHPCVHSTLCGLRVSERIPSVRLTNPR